MAGQQQGQGAHAELWDEVNTWLDEHWNPDLSVDEWWQLVADAGWAAPQFPEDQGGRGLTPRTQKVVKSAFDKYGALMPPGGLGMLMAAPTILNMGTPEQIERHVTPILTGQLAWCQLFSEPGAGSDLAGVTTRATRDGDRWIINGQKVWSSMARDCDWGMLVARTNWDVPKHKGISWFAIKLDQPGITIRPLKEMTGDDIFNEVFFDDAVVEADDLIGGEGNGWMVTKTTLFFERTGIGAGGGSSMFPTGGPKGGFLGRRAGDAALDRPDNAKLTLAYDDVADVVRATGTAADPIVRQDLMRLYTYEKLGEWNALRGKAEAKQGGGQSVSSIGKIAQTRIVKLGASLSMQALGADGTLAGADGHDGGVYSKAMVFSAASSIYGGTDEIQRNIIGEQSLGLPREPAPERGLPFRDVPTNASR